MDNHQLEQRILALEKELSTLKESGQKVYEFLSLSTLQLELAVERIDDQLKEYDMVRTAAIRSYACTHPEVTNDMVRLDEILGILPRDFKKPPSGT
jgi:hypothetical protein